MNAENARAFVAELQIAGILNEIGAADFHLNDRALIDHAIDRAVAVRAMQDGRRHAGRSGELEEFLLGLRAAEANERRDGDYDGSNLDEVTRDPVLIFPPTC